MKPPPIPAWLAALPLSRLLDLLVDGVCVLDGKGRIVAWNDTARDITGYTAEEALGRTPDFLEGLGCPGFRALGELLQRPEGEDEVRSMECKVLVRDGRPVRLFGNARVLRDAGGTPLGAVACFMDVSAVERERERAEALREELETVRGPGRLQGRSKAMQEVFRRIRLAARRDVTVLLTGESGTGKELAARAIHEAGPRRDGPFVAVHCAALPETLLESELFGHVKGAFTGATRDARGRFERADGGTLFLDEIGELTPLLQVKLLRALEERTIERLGEGVPRRVDVRIVAATHRDLARMVSDGRMREDFYWRIRVFPITMPPLRERPADVPALAEHLLAAIGARAGSGKLALDPEALHALTAAPWPGNVRELRNALEHAAVVARDGVIRREDLPPLDGGPDAPEDATDGATPSFVPAPRTPTAPRRHRPLDPESITTALEEAGGSVAAAAARLGVSRVTLWRRRRDLGLLD